MKRYSYLFDDIVSMDNLRLAHKNASRGKKKYEEVIEVDKDADKYCKNIRRQLMKVQSNERPDKVQVIGDKTYLNLDIKDISYSDENSNGVSMFEYIQFKFPHPVPDEVLLKTEKEYKLQTIVVTTQNGNTFDGNETARNNMTSAIISADVIGRTEEYWKLADNTVKLIQLAELKEALALSIQEVGSIVTAGVR